MISLRTTKERYSRPTTCIYCGKPANTRDHVPPRAIFPEPRPSNLITVPSCSTCNNSASRLDEGFRNIIGIRAAIGSPGSFALLKKSIRSLQRNRPKLEELRATMQDVPVFTASGIYVGEATEAQFEAEPHDRTIERITRGLYFHHFCEPLPPGSLIEVMFIRDGAGWRSAVAPFLPRMQIRNISGASVFEYAFARAADKTDGSLWLCRFYARHVASAVTGTLAQ